MRVVALTGGIGGAKLALGLASALPAEHTTFVVNTGDDFEHLGFHISPDLDTLVYTLAGEASPESGWGRRGETWQFMAALSELGGEAWFQLGDKDLALHVARREALRAGATLTAVTARLAGQLGVAQAVLPMSDDPVRTVVHTAAGPLPFQHYFVRDRCAPAVTGFAFAGSESARANPRLEAALAAGPDAIVICPSNPFVSIDPILAVPGLAESLRGAGAPIIAVSPIVGGRAIKGPTAKMMRELAIPATAHAVAQHYAGLIDGFILDAEDAAAAAAVERLGIATRVTQTVMRNLADRVALAEAALDFAAALAQARAGTKTG